MRLLLDTHTLLWHVSGDAKLSGLSFDLIENTENQVFVSVASLWELAIKVSLGKLELHGAHTIQEFVEKNVSGNDFEMLSIAAKHLDRLKGLPLHHRDPFDRLIVAQALTEDLTLLSRDGSLADYGVKLLW